MKDQTKRNLVNGTVAIFCIVIGLLIGRVTKTCPGIPFESEQATIETLAEEPLSDWQIFQIALAKTESEFNFNAKGTSQDHGVLQITPVLVKEVNRLQKDSAYCHKDAFDPEKSFEMFEIIQFYYNPNCKIDRAISIWNPKGEAIGYPKKVQKNIEFVKNYEIVRALVKK